MPTVHDNDLLLSELMSTWMCHALVGSVGAVVNGLELLREDPSALAETMVLLDASALATTRRLKFFRAAFGQSVAGARGDAQAFRTVLEEFLAISRSPGGAVIVHWPSLPAERRFDQSVYRLVLLLALLAMDCLPRGGTITISAEEKPAPPGISLVLDAAGRSARLDAGVAAALRPESHASPSSVDSLVPRNAPAAFAASMARRLGGNITFQTGPEHVILSAVSLQPETIDTQT
ncbi:MAG: histidine phosphotransferase family protein [Alphaproteobacteria bacterium]